MERIASFSIDHTRLQPGIYLSRRDGTVVTLDLRFRRRRTALLVLTTAYGCEEGQILPEAAEAAREACRLEPSNQRLEENAALLERLAQRSAGEEDPPFTGI